MGKSALITGASRGIGRAIAEALAGEGMDLYLLCHNNIEMLDELACRLTVIPSAAMWQTLNS